MNSCTLALAGAVLLASSLFVGCDPASTLAVASISGAEFITFRCVPEHGGEGLPLEGCGCTERVLQGGVDVLHQMGRLECDCTHYDRETTALTDVEWVATDPDACVPVMVDGCQTGWSCAPTVGEDGDWISGATPGAGEGTEGQCGAVLKAPSAILCVPRRDGQVRAYVGSTDRGEVAIVDVTRGDPDDSDAEKRILDVDPSIPGVTAVFVDDLISDIEAHPHGDYVFTVNSSTGSVSVLLNDRQLTAAYRVELGVEALLEAAVWPSAEYVAPILARRARAYVSAPLDGIVLELDLDALRMAAPEIDGGLGEAAPALVTRVFEISSVRPEMPGRPAQVAVSPAGDLLFVGHGDAAVVSVFDLVGDAPERLIDLRQGPLCDDGFLVGVLEDGEVGFDPDAPCRKVSQCDDGVDNDGDGAIDGDDTDCEDPASLWEGPVPACANGVDDDGDGRIDRADGGCATEADDDERDVLELSTCANGLDDDGDGRTDRDDDDCLFVEGLALPEEGVVGLCGNGEDDDGDGLIDMEDPGCNDYDARARYTFERSPACRDLIDNDHDGLLDFGPGGDPDCYAASDTNEGGASVDLGPRELLLAQVEVDEVEHTFLYVVGPDGRLSFIDVNDPGLEPHSISLNTEVLALTARTRFGAGALLMVGADSQLRAVQIAASRPLVTEDGHPIFGRNSGRDLFDFEQQELDAFYVVVNGEAWRVPALDVYAGIFPLEGPLALPIDDAVVAFSLPEDPADRVPLEVVSTLRDEVYDRGSYDPRAFQAGGLELLHEEANVRLTARGFTSQVVDAPRLTVREATVAYELDRSPAFCRLPQVGEAPLPEGCVPVGYLADGTLESYEAQAYRTRHRIEGQEAIQLTVEDPSDAISDTFSLAFEETLPGTTRRTGQWGGREDADHWVMLDYSADFCGLGVEPDDVLLVEVFVPLDPAAGNDPECAALDTTGQSTIDLREPLRYRVAEVGQHRLALVRAPRLSYAPQRARDDRSTLPGLYPAPDAPPHICAAQFISYEVRVGNDQWLLTGQRTGYRHSQVARGGQCVVDAQRQARGRVGRVRIGETFQNEWFRFRFDAWRGEGGVPPLESPFMVGSAYTFDVRAGTAYERLSDVAVLPREIRWLPTDDHVYIVDNALRSVVEAAGFEAYHDAMSFVRRIR